MRFRAHFLIPSIIAALSLHARAVSLINLSFSGGMTAEQQQTFTDAAAYWNSVITGYDLIHDGNGNQTPHSLTITAQVSAIDGLSGVLGSAGPETATYYDNNPLGAPTSALFYTTTGSMFFDSDDVSLLIANQLFYGVVLHEMAHVLGIGSLWTFNSDLNATNYPLYTTGSGKYYGPNALAAWQNEYGQTGATYVPVELGGGDGTRDFHWNEIDGGFFDTGITSGLSGLDLSHELMTGWASDPFYISTLTLGGLDDLGYIVDYSKAGLAIQVPEPSIVGLLGLGILLGTIRKSRFSFQIPSSR